MTHEEIMDYLLESIRKHKIKDFRQFELFIILGTLENRHPFSLDEYWETMLSDKKFVKILEAKCAENKAKH